MNKSFELRSPFIVRGPAVAAFRDADLVRAEAHAEAQAIREQALADADEIRRNAMEEGAHHAASLLRSTHNTADRYQRSREVEMVELAFGIAYRLVMDIPRDERTAALVRTALAEHTEWNRLRLRAHPTTAPMLRASLASSGIDVREDETLATDECVLLHPDGRTDLGPVQQFRALMSASGIGGA